METVGVSKLRDNMVMFLKKVGNGERITITSRGHGIARLGPVKSKKKNSKNELKKLRKTAFVGDVLSPVSEAWEAMK